MCVRREINEKRHTPQETNLDMKIPAVRQRRNSRTYTRQQITDRIVAGDGAGVSRGLSNFDWAYFCRIEVNNKLTAAGHRRQLKGLILMRSHASLISVNQHLGC